MQIQVLKSKIHNAFVTEANIDYVDSITIDENLMNAVGLIEGEQVHIINHRNGERLITYVVKGKKVGNNICINGPAVLKISKGDKIIVISYATIALKDVKKFNPKIIFPKFDNSI